MYIVVMIKTFLLRGIPLTVFHRTTQIPNPKALNKPWRSWSLGTDGTSTIVGSSLSLRKAEVFAATIAASAVPHVGGDVPEVNLSMLCGCKDSINRILYLKAPSSRPRSTPNLPKLHPKAETLKPKTPKPESRNPKRARSPKHEALNPLSPVYLREPTSQVS